MSCNNLVNGVTGKKPDVYLSTLLNAKMSDQDACTLNRHLLQGCIGMAGRQLVELHTQKR